MPTNIVAIDPGCDQSAYCIWTGQRIVSAAILSNDEILHRIDEDAYFATPMYIEEVASYGMAVGKEVFRTCFAYGRFAEAHRRTGIGEAVLVERRFVKLHHCHSARATDANIRTALIDRFGAPGKKASPGVLYSVKSHIWAALALAVYAWDTQYGVDRKSA